MDASDVHIDPEALYNAYRTAFIEHEVLGPMAQPLEWAATTPRERRAWEAFADAVEELAGESLPGDVEVHHRAVSRYGSPPSWNGIVGESNHPLAPGHRDSMG